MTLAKADDANGDGTVYLIDDDEAFLDSLGLLLETEGLAVLRFASASDFLKNFDPAGKHCVLVDVRMPEMNGLELQKRLQDRNPQTPVIVMTGHGDVAMAVTAMKAGAKDFIEKPCAVSAVLKSVRDAFVASVTAPVFHSGQGRLDPEAAQRISTLTPRERDVLDCLLQGETNKEIARSLGISPRTVDVHRANLMEKTRTNNLPSLIQLAVAAGI